MGTKSKRQTAFERFKYSDPGWEAIVIPIAGSSDSSIVASKVDSHTGRRMYGQQLARYKSKTLAEKLAADLNATRNAMLAKAFP